MRLIDVEIAQTFRGWTRKVFPEATAVAPIREFTLGFSARWEQVSDDPVVLVPVGLLPNYSEDPAELWPLIEEVMDTDTQVYQKLLTRIGGGITSVDPLNLALCLLEAKGVSIPGVVDIEPVSC